jgi:hypothetical protein
MMVGCLRCRNVLYLVSSGTGKNVSFKIKREYFILYFRDYVRQIIHNEAKLYTFGSDYVSKKHVTSKHSINIGQTMYVDIVLTIQITFLIQKVKNFT